MSKKEFFPNALEFSPGQVELSWLLEQAVLHDGDYDGMVEAIRERYFSEGAPNKADHTARWKQQLTRARNVLWGMRAYGLYDTDTGTLSGLGRHMSSLSANDQHVELARHLLTSLEGGVGLDVIDSIRSLHARREKPTKVTLARELERSGYNFSVNPTQHTKMKNWLERADVVSAKYEINEARLQELIGATSGDVSELTKLTVEQRAFLITLKDLSQTHGTAPVPSQMVREVAEQRFGRIFKESHIKERVRDVLQKLGYIVQSDSGEGRGGKSGTVSATDKLVALDPAIFDSLPRYRLPADLVDKIDMPLEDVRHMLASNNKFDKGMGLELLALKIMVDVGVTPVFFRLRAAQAGYAEADLVCEAANLLYSRWMVQCKNTASVEVSDLAREIGLAVLYKAHVIVIITTGKFRDTVVRHAELLAETTTHQVVLIDGKVLKRYFERGGQAMFEFLNESSANVLRLKTPQYGLATGPAEPVLNALPLDD